MRDRLVTYLAHINPYGGRRLMSAQARETHDLEEAKRERRNDEAILYNGDGAYWVINHHDANRLAILGFRYVHVTS